MAPLICSSRGASESHPCPSRSLELPRCTSCFVAGGERDLSGWSSFVCCFLFVPRKLQVSHGVSRGFLLCVCYGLLLQIRRALFRVLCRTTTEDNDRRDVRETAAKPYNNFAKLRPPHPKLWPFPREVGLSPKMPRSRQARKTANGLVRKHARTSLRVVLVGGQ